MSDSQIIKLIREGGQPELGKVYETYRSEFLQWIAREFHFSDDDSKDIYQITILIFHDNIRSGKVTHISSSVKTYLFAIGKNVARDHMRKARRNVPIAKERALKEHLVDEPDDVIDENVFAIARNALQAMGEPCRQLLEMYYYEKRSMEEISDRLNYKNADTAKNQKCKCMARLRKLVDKAMNGTKIPSTI